MKSKILDLIDFEKVNALLEGFNKTTGFVTAILDLDGNILSKSGWRQICTEFHRINPETSKKCTISDTQLANKISEGEKYYFYKCLNGLVDVAVPIIINGEHIANLFSGQFFFEEPDSTFFKKQAEKYGFDEVKYMAALKNVPVVSQEKVKTAMDFLQSMTQMISDMTFQKLEQIELNKIIRENEENLSITLHSIGDGVITTDKSGMIDRMNPVALKLCGWQADEIKGKSLTEVFNIIDVSTREPVLNPVERVIENGEIVGLANHTVLVAKDGKEYQIADSAAPIKDRDGNIMGVVLVFSDITDRKQAELELAESAERYKSLHNASFGGIAIHDKGIILECNQGLSEMTGYSLEELIGMDGLLLIANEHREMVMNKIAIGYEKPYEATGLRKNGEQFSMRLEARNVPYKGKNVRTVEFRDITESKQAEEKLKLLNRAIEASSVSVVITDAEGNINYVNPFFTELTGYSYEEALGKNLRILKSGNQPKEFYKDLWDTILSGKEWTGELLNKKKNDELFWEKAIISPILNSNGIVANFVAIKEDITERKKIHAELVDAKEKAEESDKLKTAFISNISHEIRTPLNGILGFGQLLVESDLSEEERRDYFELVEKSGDRLMNTVTDYMDMAMLVSNAMVVTKKDFALETVFGKIAEKTKKVYSHKNIEFKLEIPKEAVGLTVNSDPEFIQKILDKLIENAIKFTNEGSIICGCQIKSEHLLFFVKDTGCGIDNKKLDFIFEVFRQADTTITRNYEGSGLGLTIAKGLVTLLGGVIDVASENGKGSTFYFTLPYNTLS